METEFHIPGIDTDLHIPGIDTDVHIPGGEDLDQIQLGVIVGICSLALFCLFVALCYKCRKASSKPPKVVFRSADGTILVNKKYDVLSDPAAANENQNISDIQMQSEYPSYGVTGPNPLNSDYNEAIDFSGDLGLTYDRFRARDEPAHKDDVIHASRKMSTVSSGARELSSLTQEEIMAELEVNDEETSDGEYTVYECSGFASVQDGPMEIHNPMFDGFTPKTK